MSKLNGLAVSRWKGRKDINLAISIIYVVIYRYVLFFFKKKKRF